MNPTEAKKLLDELRMQFAHNDLKKVRFSSSFILGKYFLGEPQLVSRNSIKGYFTRFFKVQQSERTAEKKIRKVVAKALAALIANKSQPADPQETFWRMSLLESLKEEKPLKDCQGTKALNQNQGLEVFQALIQDHADQQLKEIKSLSFLSSRPKTGGRIASEEDFQRYSAVFGDISYENLTLYNQFIKNSDKKQLTLLKAGLDYREQLKTQFLSTEFASSEDRLKAFAIEAKSLSDRIHKLAPEESILFMGSCGQKDVDIYRVFSLLKALPESAKKSLAEPVQQLLALDHLPSPKQFINEQIDKVFQEIDLQLGDIKFEGNLDFIKAFLPDDTRTLPSTLRNILSKNQVEQLEKFLQRGPLENAGNLTKALSADPERELPEILANNLPDSLKKKLENGLKAGFFENLAYLSEQLPPSEITEFCGLILQMLDVSGVAKANALAGVLEAVRWVPQETRAQFLRTLMENAHLLTTAEDRVKLRGKIEAEIKSKAGSVTDKIDAKVNQSIAAFFTKMRSQIPQEALQMLDPEGYFSYSNFWIECKKESSGNFTLLIYPSKNLMKYHPVQENSVQWPLKLSGVPGDKLNENLCYRLLYQTIEPQYNPDCATQGIDFYQGILQHFDKDYTLEPAFWRSLNEDFSNEIALAKLMLTPPCKSSVEASLSFCFENLSDLYLPYRVQDILEIKDEPACKMVESTIKQSMQWVEKNKGSLSPAFYQRCKATENEVTRAINKFRLTHLPDEIKGPNPLHLSGAFLKEIQKAFHKAKIDDAYIRMSKPTLAWAFGSDMEELIDALADSIGPLPKNVRADFPQKKMGEKGWLKELISSFYFFSTVIALKTVLMAAQFYRGAMSPFVVISSAHFIGKYLLPEKVQVWLMQVFGYILQKLLQATCYLLLRCIMNPEQIGQMQAFAKVLRSGLQKMAANALGRGEISFEIQPGEFSREAEKKLEDILSPKPSPISDKAIEPIKLDFRAPEPQALLSTLADWKVSRELIRQQSSEQEYLHYQALIEQIHALPIPEKDQDIFWCRVTQSEACLHQLHDLGKDLANYGLQSKSLEMKSTVSIGLYALLTMMDKLSKTQPKAGLQNFTCDPYDLIVHLQGRSLVASDLRIVQKLHAILRYYGLSFEQLPSEDEILNLRKPLLFSTPIKQGWDSICPNEDRYLQERLSDPEVLEKVYQSAFTLENFKAMGGCSADEKKELITQLCADRDLGCLKPEHVKEMQEGFVPEQQILIGEKEKVFDLLMQTVEKTGWEKRYPFIQKLLASYFLTEKTSLEEKIALLRASTNIPEALPILPDAYRLLKSHMQRCKAHLAPFIKQGKTWLFSRYSFALMGDRKLLYMTKVHRKPWERYLAWENQTIDFEKEKSELEILSHKATSDFDKKLLLSKAEKSESILRLIGQIRLQGIDLKSHWKEFYRIFFEAGQLSDLVKQQPHLTAHILKFFKSLFDQQIQDSKWDHALWVVYIWRKAYPLLDPQAKESLQLIDYLKQVNCTSFETKVLFHRLRALLINDVRHMDRPQAVSLLMSNFSLVWNSDDRFYDLNLECKQRFLQAFGSLKETLNSPDYAKGILPELAKQLGQKSLAKTDRFAVFCSENLEFDCVKGLITSKQNPVEIITPAPDTVSVDIQKAPGLHLLGRVCPLSTIKLTAKAGKVHTIEFTPLNLSFKIKDIQGNSRAVNAELLGDFYIAPKQFDPQFNAFGNYLLLQNDSGAKKILLPQGQWVSSFLTRFAEGAGPWLSVFTALLDRRTAEENGSFSVFNVTAKGRLISDKPEDMAFLTILHLVQGKNALGKEACMQFQKNCKHAVVGEGTYAFILPLLVIPLDVEGMILTRQRMLAAIEESQSSQTRPRIELSSSVHGWIATIILTDLMRQKDQSLSEFEEWFLFKAFYHHASNMVKTEKVKTPTKRQKVWDFAASHMRTTLETLILPDSLTRRFEALEKKLGKERTFAESAIRFASKVMRTPSTVPTFNREIIRPLSQVPEPSFVKELWNVGIRSVLSNSFDISSLKLPSLVLQLREADQKVSFKLVDLTPEKFKKGYLTYYAIAKAGSLYQTAIDKFQSPFQVSGFKAQKFVGLQDKSNELKELLPLLKGGWDKQTQILIDYLNCVYKFPWCFPAVEAFEKAVTGHHLELIAFFETMNARTVMLSRFGSFTLKNAAKFIDKKIIGDVMVSQFPLFGLRFFTLPVLRLAESTLQVITKDRSVEASSVQEKIPLHYFSYLNDEDHLFDQEMDALFSLAYVDNLTTVKLKNEKSLWFVYCELLTKLQQVRLQLDKERQKLLNFVTEGPQSDPSLLFEQLQECFLKGDFTEVLKKAAPPADVVQSLELAFACHLVRCTRLQQMERALSCVEELALKAPSEQTPFIQRFAETLREKRVYPFTKLSMRVLRRLIVYEYQSRSLLSQEQFSQILQMTSSSQVDGNLFAALLNSLKVNKNRIGVHILSGEKHLEEDSVFSKSNHIWQFDRGTLFNLENLSAMQTILQSARERGETIAMTAQTTQSMELIFLDRMQAYIQNEESNQQTESVLMQIGQILKALRTYGNATEGANQARLKFPIGPASIIQVDDYQMIEACMLEAHAILGKESKIFSEDEFSLKVAKPIAEVIAKRFTNLKDVERNELVIFCSNRKVVTPSWIKEHVQFRQFCMVRGVLTELLFHTRSPISSLSLSNPYEALVNTFDMNLRNGLNEAQLEQLKPYLKAESKTNEQLIALYMRTIERPKMRFWKESLCSSQEDFNEMFEICNPLPALDYHAYIRQLKAKARRVCLDKVIGSDSFDQMRELFDEFRLHFINKTESDPRKLFGPLKITRKSALFCEKIRTTIFASLDKSTSFTDEDKLACKQMREALLPPVLPETVQVFFGDSLKEPLGLMDKLDVNQPDPSFKFKEGLWKKDFNPHVGPAPFMSIRDLLAASKEPAFAAVQDQFSPHIGFSHNFLPVFANEKIHLPFASKYQCDLFNLLIQVEETTSEIRLVAAGCISLKDTADLRALFKIHPATTQHKAFIYDVESELPVGGALIALDQLRQSPSVIAAIAELKFLNGALHYTPEQINYLEHWLKKETLSATHAAFEQIQLSRKGIIAHSDIDFIFEK